MDIFAQLSSPIFRDIAEIALFLAVEVAAYHAFIRYLESPVRTKLL